MSTIARQGRGFRAGYALLYLAFLYVPVLFLPLFSFNRSIYIAFPIEGWTLKWYGTLLENERLHEALGNSLEIAGISSLLATTLAIFAAKAFTRYSYRGQRPSLAVVMLPMVLPEIIVGVSLLILLNQIGLGLGTHSVIIGHTLICLPFAVAVLMSRMEGFDRNLEEASLDLGEGPVATFFRVTLPLILPGVVASLLLTFTISFDEFIIAFFLSATDTTLPVFIWSQLRFPQRLPTVLALGACILVASGALVVFSEWIRRRGHVKAGPGIWN